MCKKFPGRDFLKASHIYKCLTTMVRQYNYFQNIEHVLYTHVSVESSLIPFQTCSKVSLFRTAMQKCKFRSEPEFACMKLEVYFIVAYLTITNLSLLLSDKEGTTAPHKDTIGRDVGRSELCRQASLRQGET